MPALPFRFHRRIVPDAAFAWSSALQNRKRILLSKPSIWKTLSNTAPLNRKAGNSLCLFPNPMLKNWISIRLKESAWNGRSLNSQARAQAAEKLPMSGSFHSCSAIGQLLPMRPVVLQYTAVTYRLPPMPPDRMDAGRYGRTHYLRMLRSSDTVCV